jgi:hypothetical protein
MLPSPPGADIHFRTMTGSRAEDIVGDFFESDDWGELVEGDPVDSELDEPLPPSPPEAA